jgi:hypothetical protein
MIPSAASQVLALADSNGWQTCVEKTREERGEDGQFFTPPVIARCLAEWFQPESFNRPSLHLLDPGAGGGVLTAALVDGVSPRSMGSVLANKHFSRRKPRWGQSSLTNISPDGSQPSTSSKFQD